MSCCPESITTFAGVSSSTVPYSGEYGANPKVTVLYYQDGIWVASGIATIVTMIGKPVTQVKVDHGGPATGLIKIS